MGTLASERKGGEEHTSLSRMRTGRGSCSLVTIPERRTGERRILDGQGRMCAVMTVVVFFLGGEINKIVMMMMMIQLLIFCLRICMDRISARARVASGGFWHGREPNTCIYVCISFCHFSRVAATERSSILLSSLN